MEHTCEPRSLLRAGRLPMGFNPTVKRATLPRPSLALRPLGRLSSRGRRLDLHLHPLAAKEGKVAARKTENYLEHAVIAFGFQFPW